MALDDVVKGEIGTFGNHTGNLGGTIERVRAGQGPSDYRIGGGGVIIHCEFIHSVVFTGHHGESLAKILVWKVFSMLWYNFVLAALIGYLIGSIPFGYLSGRLKGIEQELPEGQCVAG